MPALEITEVDKPIVTGLDEVTPGENSWSSHLRWELVQVMSRVRPEDLSAVEISALLAILAPADTRVIGGPADRPKMPILGVRGKHPASNLA
jgi:hypothetical protein